VLLDPLEVGEIADDDHHNITYDALGHNPTLHSEPRRFRHTFGGGRDNAPELKTQPITREYVHQLSEELVRRTAVSKFRRSITAEVEQARPIERVQIILGRVYQVTWFLL
jgi:hypothetical protein